MRCKSYMSAKLSGVSEQVHGVIAFYCLSNERLEDQQREAFISGANGN